MFSLSWVCIFKQWLSVKISQSMCIFWKMCRYPVKNNTNIILMQIINHISKIFRRSITRSRCIISCHLITPGAIIWILRNSHQFHVCISHILYIFCDSLCKFTICIESFIFSSRMSHPRTHMHFINRHWVRFLIPLFSFLHP